MQTFELTTEEAEMLREVLRHALTEMDVEVFRTDTHNYKDMLKHRQHLMQQVLDKISAPTPAW